MDHVFIGVCQRFEELGYKLPGNTCYIHCGNSCAEYYAAWEKLSEADKAITVIKTTSHAATAASISATADNGGFKKKTKKSPGSKKLGAHLDKKKIKQ